MDFVHEQLGKGNDVVGVKVGRIGRKTADEVGVPVNPPPPINCYGGARGVGLDRMRSRVRAGAR
jgi:hypothetical protein